MKKIILILLSIFTLNSCEKGDNNSDNTNQPTETVVVAERIEFSSNNQIPSELNILSLEGKSLIENSPIQEPSIGSGLEMLVDGNNKPIFFKRNYPNYSNQKINSESTILFLATFNSSFNSFPTSIQSQMVDNILSHPIFGDLVSHLNAQTIIDLYSEYIIENLILLITDIFDIDLTIDENNFQLASVNYSSNSQVVTIVNPTHNYVAYGIYNNNISNTLQLIPPISQIELNLPSTYTEYNIKIMSGENVSTDLYGNLELEEIEAFNADMVGFMDDAFGFILGPFDSEDNCFIGALNQIYTGVDLAQECSNTNGPFDGIKCAIDFGFLLYADTLEVSDDCELIDLDSISEIFDLIGEILDAFDGSELIAEMAVKIQDYYLYENQYQICLLQDDNGVIICEEFSTEPATSISPSNGEIDVELSGSLNFQAGQNTPTDATFRVLFDESPNPSFVYNLNLGEMSLSYSDLESLTNYYWKVQTISNSSEVIAESPVWSFTTMDATTVTDIDGNVYETVQIGTQIWLKENLKVTHYADGSPLQLITGDTNWADLDEDAKAYTMYNDNTSNVDIYGLLYNFSGITNGVNSTSIIQGICPDGWHIPSFDEWLVLSDFLNPNSGGKLKSVGTTQWSSPNTGANNSSGFTAIPSGLRHPDDGSSAELNNFAMFYTSTRGTGSTTGSQFFGVTYDSEEAFDGLSGGGKSGRSCRCIKD